MSRPPAFAYTLVIFSWCPRGGVGSRRWSKFCKYLSYRGIATDVITARYPYKDVVNWCHDVRGLSLVSAYHAPLRYPAYLLRPRRNPLIRLGDRILKRTTHRFDAAEQWAKSLPKLLVARGGDNTPIVLTVPPFSLLSIVPNLRARFPGRKLILDYRDSWSLFLPQGCLRPGGAEYDLELDALKASSEVWVTTAEHAEYLALNYRITREKVVVIPNGYDPEDYARTQVPGAGNGRAIYPGWMTGRRLQNLLPFLEALERRGEPALLEQFRIDFYSEHNVPDSGLTRPQRSLVDKYLNRHASVPPTEITKVIAQYSYGLVVDQEDFELRIPIKHFDYLALNRLIISLGPIGAFHRALAEGGHLVSDLRPGNLDAMVEHMNVRLTQPESAPRMTPGLADQYALPTISARVAQRIKD